MPIERIEDSLQRRASTPDIAPGETGPGWRLRRALARTDAGTIVLVGFVAALGWAFFGSLALGLGAGAEGRHAALLWLAAEVLIGFAVLAAVLFAAPPHDRGGP